MQSYYKKDELTNKAIVNNWFYTQDIAQYTHDGNIELKGRKRNIIKTATEAIVDLDEIQDFVGEMEQVEDNVVCSFESDEKRPSHDTLSS